MCSPVSPLTSPHAWECQTSTPQVAETRKFFSIFYMAINAGSVLSMIITPILRGQLWGWHLTTHFPLFPTNPNSRPCVPLFFNNGLLSSDSALGCTPESTHELGTARSRLFPSQVMSNVSGMTATRLLSESLLCWWLRLWVSVCFPLCFPHQAMVVDHNSPHNNITG